MLRYGQFYGPGTYYERDGSIGKQVRKRMFPIVGAGTGMVSFIHVDDAAAATVAALDHGDPGIYNVTDDEPAPPARMAARLRGGARRAEAACGSPTWLARIVGGKMAVEFALEAARRLEREGEARARLAARSRQLAHRSPRSARLAPAPRIPPMTDLEAAKGTLLAELREHSLVIGEVTLSSGATAQYYVDARRALLRPAGFLAAGELIAAAASEAGASAVGGPVMAAIPLACAAIAVPGGQDLVGFFVRKERKEHGLQHWVEGPVEAGARCLVVEDTVTTGGSTVGGDRADPRAGPGDRRRAGGGRSPRRRRRADRGGGRGALPGPGHDRRDPPRSPGPCLRLRIRSRSASSAA